MDEVSRRWWVCAALLLVSGCIAACVSARDLKAPPVTLPPPGTSEESLTAAGEGSGVFEWRGLSFQSLAHLHDETYQSRTSLHDELYDFGASRRTTTALSEMTSNKEAPAYFMEMLLCWKAVAAAAGIKWVLGGGTMLGAVRDGAIIPWDGDVDTQIAGTKEWTRVYPLYFGSASGLAKLRKFADAQSTCSNSKIIFPSAGNSNQSPYVTARVVWRSDHGHQVDITAPYVGNYSTVSGDIEKIQKKYGFDYNFEDTRCVHGCPFFVSTSCSGSDPYRSYAQAEKLTKNCSAFIDYFIGTPRPCSLGSHKFLCPQRSEELLVNDYGLNWKTPMYSSYYGGQWHKAANPSTTLNAESAPSELQANDASDVTSDKSIAWALG